ncbi:alpha-mannosidase 2-like [Spodoptera litura]|uniref:Alpha-mannosidase 2-like n=1 Tax=Spodoptera litura TaxID=69820 RepID=A0A9J7ERL9_SPOLT|nr:alpha-mannosidase 2-like [Spodoptera litura]
MASTIRVCASVLIIIVLLLTTKVACYEKTLRKIVRNQSKMVQRPFSENTGPDSMWKNLTNIHSVRVNEDLLFPTNEMKTVFHNIQRPKISTMLTSLETSKGKAPYSKTKISNPATTNELRLTRNTFTDINVTREPPRERTAVYHNFTNANNIKLAIKNYYQIPTPSKFFPPIEEHGMHTSTEQRGTSSKENTVIIPNFHKTNNDKEDIQVKGILIPKSKIKTQTESTASAVRRQTMHSIIEIDPENEKADFLIEGLPMDSTLFTYNLTSDPYTCSVLKIIKTDIDAQEKFSQLNIEPFWTSRKHFWNHIFDSRYESLMRNPKWPPLKVILVPRTHVDSIWRRSFGQYHNDSVNKILTNIVKKLQFYNTLTFSWNEVSHLSYWWKTTTHRNRAAFRKLLRSGRLEITTGGWVEPDEATSHLFGLVHQLTEGHQWLKQHLNYTPKVAWLTNSVTHSPTMTYLLAASNVNELVFTNVHYAWEQFLAEYQYSDFIWLQSWDDDKTYPSNLNDVLNRMGNDRYPKHAVLTHYLQFNSAGFRACGPNGPLCATEYNFATNHRNLDVSAFNVKEKSELLLEQYSKTGTISPHNTIIAPLGGPYHYEMQAEFDFQFNNYQKISDFVAANKEIYKASIEFGTTKDYFDYLKSKHKQFPTFKGDFLNFADISGGSPAYWTGFYTSRPFTKILLRRLHSTLRTTEILFSFALNLNVFRRSNISQIYELLIKTRETVARLVDRNVLSGTVSANALKYVHSQILNTARDCWYIQEISASFLSLKPEKHVAYLQKYVYRNGEFTSVLRTVSPGDQVYIFNSLSHERTEIVELTTRYPNIRIVDHNKRDVTVQINPVWTYTSENLIKLSRMFYKIVFAVMMPPLTLELFKIKDTYDASQNAATIYCLSCHVDDVINNGTVYPFTIQPIQSGDIQLESYKHRLLFDEFTGFLKTVIEKETNIEKNVIIDYGAFRDSDFNSGMFLFNTNTTKPLHDILGEYRSGNKKKILLIVSGLVTTEITSIYGRLLQHTTKIFNLLRSPLSGAIYMESKVDYEVSPKYRELELFLSIQTDINNGNPPEIFTDNNGFQYTSRILNISRRIESNMYPITSMAFIQDRKTRLTFITDHAQGVTALQEGQMLFMLDRRVLYNDGRGTHEGLADSTTTCHRNYILMENLMDSSNPFNRLSHKQELKLPSLTALHLSNALDYLLDIFLIEKNHTELCYYTFLPLVKTSFPCDVSLVNFRAILHRSTFRHATPNSALMTLHRQSFSCQVENSAELHCGGDSHIFLKKLLRNIKKIDQMNLPGTDEGVPVFVLSHTNFPPMELTTLRIQF